MSPGAPGHRVPDASVPMAEARPAITALALAAACVVAVEFIVVGLLPLLTADLRVELPRAAWLVSAFALSATVLGPPLTLYIARWHARPALVWMLLLYAASNLLAAAWPTFGTGLAMRVLQGALLTPLISLASTEAVRLAKPGGAGEAMARVNQGVVVGSVLLVPAGIAAAGTLGWQSVYALLGLATLTAACLVRSHLRDVWSSPQRGPQPLGLLTQPLFFVHLLASTAMFTTMFAGYSFIALWLGTALGLGAAGVATALLGFGLAGIAGNALAGRLVERHALRLGIVLALLLPLVTSALGLGPHILAWQVLLLAVWGAVHAAGFLACQARVIFAAPTAPAFAASLNIAACNLGIALGALVGGRAIEIVGLDGFGLATIVPALATALLLLWLCVGSQRLPGARTR